MVSRKARKHVAAQSATYTIRITAKMPLGGFSRDTGRSTAPRMEMGTRINPSSLLGKVALDV
jgi:hypothetical protein